MYTYLPHVGFVRFPRRPSDLAGDVCPACFTARIGESCGGCGLDLTSPIIVALDSASTDAAASLDRRLELIGRIRFDSAAAAAARADAAAKFAAAANASHAAQAAAQTMMAATVTTTPRPVTPAPTKTAAPSSSPRSPAEPTLPSRDAPARSHVGVQVLLLVVGVALLSIGAIFFLVYAFINFGLVWRSVIIATVTLTAILSASLLQRRRLTATAESVAALGVVLVYLDAFAIRENNLLGLGAVDALTYWGAVAVMTSIGFVGWYRLAGIRLPSIVGFAGFAPGAALLVAGLTSPFDDAERVFASFAVLTIATLVYPAARGRSTETLTMLSVTIVGLVGGAASSIFLRIEDDWAPAIALGLIAIVCLAHVVVAIKVTSSQALASVVAAVGALTASLAVLTVAVRVPELPFFFFAPATSAAIVALTLELIFHRTTAPMPRRLTLVAAWSAGVVALLLVLMPLVASLGPTLSIMSGVGQPWSVEGTSVFRLEPYADWAVMALALILVLCAATWGLSSSLARRRAVLVGGGYAVAILATPLLEVLWAILAVWLLLGAAGVLALVTKRSWTSDVRGAVAVGAIASAVAAYIASWMSVDTWLYGSVGAIVLLIGARWSTQSQAVRSLLLSVAAVLALIAAAGGGIRLNEEYATGSLGSLAAVHAVIGMSVILMAFSAAGAGRLVSSTEARPVFWIAFAAAGASAAISWNTTTALSENALGSIAFHGAPTRLALGAALVIALLSWVLPRVLSSPLKPSFRVERLVASIAVAPSLAWVLDSFTRALELPALIGSVAPISAALIVSAGTLAVAVLRPDGVPRWAREVGVALVTVPALAAAALRPGDATWLAFVLSAVTVLLVAVSHDGLFGSASSRRHIGWLALALACTGLWWKLGDDRVQNLESYVLPLAGMLLGIALLTWRARKDSGASPLMALVGLLVAIVPLAADSTSGSLARAFAVVGASAALLIGGSFVVRFVPAAGRTIRPYVDVAAFAGAVGIVIGGIGHAVIGVMQGRTNDLTLDVWLGGSVLTLLIAAIGQALTGEEGTRKARAAASQGIAAGAAIGVVLTATAVLGGTFMPVEPARGVALLVLVCVIQIAALILDRSRYTRLLDLPRPGREVSLALIGSSVLIFAVIRPTDATWLSLIVSGLLVLFFAVSDDGVFGSASRRRYLGWIALAFCSSGLWWRLSDEAVRDVAPYVLPLAGALLLIALLTWLPTRGGESATNSVAPLIALAGLVIGLVPLAAESTTGPIAQAFIIAGSSALLLLIGSFVPGSPGPGGSRLRRHLDVAAVAGALGLVVAGVGRAATMAGRGTGMDPALDAWLIGTLVVLVLAATGQRMLAGNARLVGCQLLLGMTLLAMVVIEFSVITTGQLGAVRAIVVLLVLSSIYVAGLLVDSGPFSRPLGWVAIALAASTGLFAEWSGAVDPFEWSTVVLATALLAVGVSRLRRSADAGSWPWLAPGTFVLLGPSLLATFADAPVWRLVALGFACVLVIMAGATRGLQAPLLIGSTIVLIHAIRTFSPQLVLAYQATEWWVWAVIGGAVIFFTGFTFEKRKRDFTKVTARVAGLR